MIFIALGVFLTQGSQIRGTATVLSEQCHSQYDPTVDATEMRCNATVQFASQSGQIIRTMVSGALPSEFSHRPARRTTIQVRYDSSDPTQPFKQSNFMSVGEFLVVLGIGAVFTALGIRAVLGAERFAEKAVQRRLSQAL